MTNEDLKELYHITHLLLHGKFYVGSGSGTGVRHAGFDSETGVQQGAVDAPFLFCWLIAVANKQTDELLDPVGGAIASGMDDTYLLGPAAEVFAAMPSHEAALKATAGLTLNRSKTFYYARPHMRTPDLDALRGDIMFGCIPPPGRRT